MVLSNYKSPSRNYQYTDLEGIILAALVEIGVVGTHITFLSDTGNLIFRVDGKTQSFAIRVYKDSGISNTTINAELRWLLDLKQNTNLSVPEPITIQPIKIIQEILYPEAEKPVKFVVFHWLPGEIIGSQLNLDSASHMGEMMAALHLHANQFQLPPDCFRDENDWRGMGHFKAGLSDSEIQRIECI